MTHPHVFAADVWRPLPRRTATSRSPWPSLPFELPAQRALLVVLALAVLVLGLARMQASLADVASTAERQDCIAGAVHDARSFAAVLGDARAVPASFAARTCERG